MNDLPVGAIVTRMANCWTITIGARTICKPTLDEAIKAVVVPPMPRSPLADDWTIKRGSQYYVYYDQNCVGGYPTYQQALEAKIRSYLAAAGQVADWLKEHGDVAN